jgi:hypothetical protein
LGCCRRRRRRRRRHRRRRRRRRRRRHRRRAAIYYISTARVYGLIKTRKNARPRKNDRKRPSIKS